MEVEFLTPSSQVLEKAFLPDPARIMAAVKELF